MATLWQLIVDFVSGKERPTIKFDPLRASVGVTVTIDSLDYRDKHFTVESVIGYNRIQEVKGRPPVRSTWTDYCLRHQPLSGDDVYIRLRCHPDSTDFALLLKQDDQTPYDEGLANCLKEEKFEIRDDDRIIASYTRINSVRDPYNIGLLIRKSTEDEQRRILLFDYHRDTKDEANQDVREYYFVEQDKDSGMFTMFKGCEVSTQRINVL